MKQQDGNLSIPIPFLLVLASCSLPLPSPKDRGTYWIQQCTTSLLQLRVYQRQPRHFRLPRYSHRLGNARNIMLMHSGCSYILPFSRSKVHWFSQEFTEERRLHCSLGSEMWTTQYDGLPILKLLFKLWKSRYDNLPMLKLSSSTSCICIFA